MRVLGIDPGLSGGVALMLNDVFGSFELPLAFAMPTNEIVRNSKTKNSLDQRELFEALKLYFEPGSVAYIERVGAMPGQGTSSMFSFGRTVGATEALVMACGYRIEYVAPAVWKKRFKLGKGKDESLEAARRFWPSRASQLFPRKKDEGVAEACLIARYGMELELQAIGRKVTHATV